MDTPPTRIEIEVLLCSPGYGESIALHLGNNAWFIVDCRLDLDAGVAKRSRDDQGAGSG